MSASRSSKHRERRAGSPARDRHRGAVLIVVLVCFAVAAVLFVVLARQALAARRMVEKQLWGVQAQWVAEAAVERAAARLSADAKYSGETWTIPAAEFSGDSGAAASIRVEGVAGRPDRRLVRVEADYPDDPVHRVRWTTQAVVDRPAPPAAKKAEKP
jgi:Tfp pilus assembly protein PilX